MIDTFSRPQLRDMNQSIHSITEGNEGSEGDKPGHYPLMVRPLGKSFGNHFPRVGKCVFHAERESVVLPVELFNHHLHFLSDREDLANLLHPAPGDFRYGNEPFNTIESNKGAEFADRGNRPPDPHSLADSLTEAFPLPYPLLFQKRPVRNDD